MSDTPTPSGQPVELASQGRYYKSGRSRAVLKRIKGEYEAMLSDASAQNFPTILDQVLRDLVTEHPAESWEKLLIGDKYHLMFHLRMVSYRDGHLYGSTVTCPNCSHPNAITIDLKEDVQVRTPPEGAKEPFEIQLPTCGRIVKMRLLRVFDEIEMIKFVRRERHRGKLRGDPAYFYTIARGILSIDDDELDLDAAVQWVKEADGDDTLEIRNVLDEYDVGPELELEFTCKSCSNFWYQRMPLDADFFRPGVARRRRNPRAKI